MITKVISGGQIGADIAGLRIAKRMCLETGGWMPKGFKTKVGPKAEYAEMYGLTETPTSEYPVRTDWNVRDSNATMRLAINFNSAGERCTINAIRRYARPYFDVQLPDEVTWDKIDLAKRWIEANRITTLNIAGNANPDIEEMVESFLGWMIERLRGLTVVNSKHVWEI